MTVSDGFSLLVTGGAGSAPFKSATAFEVNVKMWRNLRAIIFVKRHVHTFGPHYSTVNRTSCTQIFIRLRSYIQGDPKSKPLPVTNYQKNRIGCQWN